MILFIYVCFLVENATMANHSRKICRMFPYAGSTTGASTV
jgi:hypothetical protein